MKIFNLIVFVLITALSFAVYTPSLKYDFTGLDDGEFVTNSALNTANPAAPLNYFTETVFNNSTDKFYRPVLMLTFYADAIITNANPFIYNFKSYADGSIVAEKPYVYHFTNILLHALALFAVFLFFTCLGFDKTLTLFGTLIFCVHPAFAQAVVWLPGRNDTLLTFTAIMCLFFLCKYLAQNKNKFLVLSALFYALSLFTKETGVALIPAVAAVMFIFFKDKLNKKNICAVSGLFIFITLIYFALRYNALKYTGQEVGIVNSAKIFIKAVPSLLNYFEYLIAPFNIAVVPDVIVFTAATYIACAVMLFAAVAAFFVKGARKSVLIFGLVWFIMFLAPTFIMPYNKFFSHRLYLPCVGLFLFCAETLSALLKKRKELSRVVYGVLIFIIVLCFPLAKTQGEKFLDTQTFWAHAISEMPNSHFVHGAVAMVYSKLGHYDKAIEHYFKALQLDRKYWRHYLNLGVTYVTLGDFDNAEKCFLEAINFNEYADAAYYNLAQLYDKFKKDDAKALDYAQKAHALLPKDKGYIEYIETLKNKV